MTNKSEKKLKQCTIVLTRNCNLRCEFCFAKEAGYKADDILSLDEVKHIVDFCDEAKIKYIFLTGGEPLTYPYILEVLQYIKDTYPHIEPTIATNGVLLANQELCKELIDSGLRYVDISTKGTNLTTWKDATGYDGYEKQLQAIRNLSITSLEFTCSMVITSDNVRTFCDAVQAAADNGGKQFSFTFFIDNIESEDKNEEYLKKHNPFLLVDEFLSQLDRLSSITDDWWIEYSFPMCVYTEKQLEQLKGRLAGPCQIHLKNAITINTRLNLLPCDMYINNPIGQLGNDFKSYIEFTELSKGPIYKSVMNKIRKRPSIKCRTCKYLKQCYGGCPVLWKNYSFEALMAFKKNYYGNTQK